MPGLAVVLVVVLILILPFYPTTSNVLLVAAGIPCDVGEDNGLRIANVPVTIDGTWQQKRALIQGRGKTK